MGVYGNNIFSLNEGKIKEKIEYNIVLSKVKYNIKIGQFDCAKNVVYRSKLSKSEKESLISLIDSKDPSKNKKK